MGTSTEHTGAMIALVPSNADLARLAIDEDYAEPTEELHLTLYYLGDAADVDTATREGMINAVTSMIANRNVPVVAGRAFGVAHWNPDGDDPAWVLNVGDAPNDEPDAESLAQLRGTISEALADGGVDFDMPEQHSPWQPHICLAYSADDRSEELRRRLGDVIFDRVRLAFGGEVTDVPLGRAATVSSALGGTVVPWSKVQNHAECPDGKPWAVVKDEGGEVEGCHASEEAANDQLAALNASERDDVHAAETVATEVVEPLVAASPPNNADDGECPDGHRRLPNGECISDEEYAVRSAWHGVLVVEGVTTGDGREFSPDALSWADNALLRWQKEGSHGGDHDVTVSVGRIDEVWRVGNQVMGRGVLDIESVDGFEIARRLGDNFAGGISIDADDIQDADVEFVWSEDPSGTAEDDPLMMLFAQPEKMIFHGGRVRAATLCDIPAFVEARIQLGTVEDDVVTLAASAASTSTSAAVVAAHGTPTSDSPWNQEFARRLPNIMPLELARSAYAWVEEPVAGRVGKMSCAYLHHEISDTGEVGAANLTACAAAIAALRVNDAYADEDRHAVYGHLAAHLRDAGQEPPPLDDESLVAAVTLDDWRPDRSWFEDPQFSVPTGITVTDDGRVYGHAAQWGECHIGFTDQCITLPREESHPYFMTGEVVCADGSRVAVGQITVGTGHAPLSYRASNAAEHYDNTGASVADVAVGNDRFGIWVAGAVRASVAASRVHELRASGRLSGDWRRIGGQLRLVGLLAVNVPGFPITSPRARVASGAPTALVAAGRTTVGHVAPVTVVEPSEDELNQLAMRRVMNVLAGRVNRAREMREV
jgi:2'-5' RNA ligase